MNLTTLTRETAALGGMCPFLRSGATNLTKLTHPPLQREECDGYAHQHRQLNASPDSARPSPIARIRPVESSDGNRDGKKRKKKQEHSRGRRC